MDSACPIRAALAPVLARWSELADGRRAAAIDLRAWHAAATAVELRIPAAVRAGITAAPLAELGRGSRTRGPAPLASPAASTRRSSPAQPSGAFRELDACVAATVGAGIGTTPAGDDVICGVLAGLDVLGLEGAHGTARRGRDAAAVGHHAQLAAPAGGRGRGPLHGESDRARHRAGSASASAVRDALAALARWGASSGLDQATGFAAAIRAGSRGVGAR